VFVPVRRRGEPVRAPEARRKRADAPQPDREADLCDRPIRGAQECRGALEAPREQVLVRGLAEGAPELAAEVGLGKMCGTCKRRDIERLPVPRVDEVLRPKQVPGRWEGDDQRSTS
jgi:hypothetical protein